MSGVITARTETRIAAKVADGHYASGDEVIEKALTLLDAHEKEQAQKQVWLKNAIREGMESGPSEPMNWDAFWQDAETRIKKEMR